MLLCLHVEFFFMLMPFTWLTDDLLKDNPPSKLRLSISAAQICLFCEKYENPRNLGIVRACADKSHLCSLDSYLSRFVPRHFWCSIITIEAFHPAFEQPLGHKHVFFEFISP